jgi:hypothetical protein
MWPVQRRREMHTGFWWGNGRDRDHFEDLSVDGSIVLKRIFKSMGSMDLD